MFKTAHEERKSEVRVSKAGAECAVPWLLRLPVDVPKQGPLMDTEDEKLEEAVEA